MKLENSRKPRVGLGMKRLREDSKTQRANYEERTQKVWTQQDNKPMTRLKQKQKHLKDQEQHVI